VQHDLLLMGGGGGFDGRQEGRIHWVGFRDENKKTPKSDAGKGGRVGFRLCRNFDIAFNLKEKGVEGRSEGMTTGA